jgi:hypothetical protein
MKCAEARKWVRLYLDSELDTKTSAEVEQHLQACAECAGLFEAERKFDDRLHAALRKGQRTAGLWDAVESRILPTCVGGRPKLLLRLAASGTVILIVLIVAALARPRTLDLAAAVEECHNAYVHQITSPEFTGPVPEEIARKLDGRLDAVAFSFRPSSTEFDSRGARLCHVQAVPVALILGQYDRVQVSVIVLRKSELEHFPSTKRRLESGHAIACSRAGRYQFAARVVDDHVVCLIGDAPRPRLEELLKTVNKPS